METIDSIFKLKQYQTQNFVENVQYRNKKESLIILNKFDLQNPIRNIISDISHDSKIIISKLTDILNKRQEFINFMSKYL